MVLALTTDDMQTIAVVILGVVVLGGVASALVVKAIVGKVISLVVMLGLGGLVWSQRASISDCVDRVKQATVASPLAPAATTCSFFGYEVEIPTDQIRPTGG
ncbi:MAG: hypothetical protein ACKO91_14740 [Acidimicrobiales bacterium]